MARYRGAAPRGLRGGGCGRHPCAAGEAGFRLQPLVDMQRPVETADGEDIAAFTIVRLAPGEMPEGRIQALTHRTEHTVWQQRWLSHPQRRRRRSSTLSSRRRMWRRRRARFQRFLGTARGVRPLRPKRHLDRGRVQLVSPTMLDRALPGLEIPALPFICGSASRCGAADEVWRALRPAAVRPARGLRHRAVPRAARRRMLGLLRTRAAVPWRLRQPVIRSRPQHRSRARLGGWPAGHVRSQICACRGGPS